MPTSVADAPPLVHNAEAMKDRQFHMRVGAEDEARLAALAKHHEMSTAQVVRMLIKREAEAVAAAAVERTRHAEPKARTESPRAPRRR